MAWQYWLDWAGRAGPTLPTEEQTAGSCWAAYIRLAGSAFHPIRVKQWGKGAGTPGTGLMGRPTINYRQFLAAHSHGCKMVES